MSIGPVLSSSAESEGAKRTAVDVCLRATAPKVSLATVEPPDHLTVAVAVPLDELVPAFFSGHLFCSHVVYVCMVSHIIIYL